jgi:hypothetical protein
MNAIRSAMSVFLLAIVAATFLGWRWAQVLPPAKLDAARLVLAVAGLASVLGLAVIWSARPRNSR